MSQFVISFRAPDRTLGNSDEAEWGKWFQRIGSSITDMGHRVGQSRRLGSNGDLGGYIVIEAGDFESAVELAKGCPGLAQGGGVEVGEVVPSGVPAS